MVWNEIQHKSKIEIINNLFKSRSYSPIMLPESFAVAGLHYTLYFSFPHFQSFQHLELTFICSENLLS